MKSEERDTRCEQGLQPPTSADSHNDNRYPGRTEVPASHYVRESIFMRKEIEDQDVFVLQYVMASRPHTRRRKHAFCSILVRRSVRGNLVSPKLKLTDCLANAQQ